MLESTGSPIVGPATGDEHRAQIRIPGGMEFQLAEMGSITATATGAIALNLENSYAQFNRTRHTGSGVVRD